MAIFKNCMGISQSSHIYGIASIPCPAMAFIPHLLTTQKDSRCFNRSLTAGRAVRPGKGDLFRIIS